MRLFPCLVLGVSLSVSSFASAAGQKLASVEINVGDKVDAKNIAGIRTLYVIVYDNASAMPRPWGAMKVDLKADAKGTVFKGDLTTENVTAMGKGPVPQSIRLKARLDKDGSAGMDQAGDIVGKADNLKAGDTAKIVIDTVIN